jgi:hypothetical protein
MKVKLKTQKQLEAMGYTYNPKSMFAPMRIDVSSDEVRLRDKSHRIIPQNIYRNLGKEVEIESVETSNIDGVECINFGSTYSRWKIWLPLAIIVDNSVSKAKNAQQAEKKKLEELSKQKAVIDSYKNKKVDSKVIVGGYTMSYYPNLEVLQAGCRNIPKKDIPKIIAFLKKISRMKKQRAPKGYLSSED